MSRKNGLLPVRSDLYYDICPFLWGTLLEIVILCWEISLVIFFEDSLAVTDIAVSFQHSFKTLFLRDIYVYCYVKCSFKLAAEQEYSFYNYDAAGRDIR